MKRIILPILLLFLLALAGTGVFLFLKFREQFSTYKDPVAGFSFKYPATISINKDVKGAKGLVLSVSTEKIADIKDSPYFSKAIAQQEESALKEGRLAPTVSWAADVKAVKLSSGNFGRMDTNLSRFEVCGVYFERGLRFYNNGYVISLTLFGEKDPIVSSMPQFFKVDKTNCGDQKIWDDAGAFYSKVSSGQGTGAAKEWFDTFEQIVSSVVVE